MTMSARLVYESPFVHYKHSDNGWSLHLRGVAWTQTALLGLLGGLWRGRGVQFARRLLMTLFNALVALVENKL